MNGDAGPEARKSEMRKENCQLPFSTVLQKVKWAMQHVLLFAFSFLLLLQTLWSMLFTGLWFRRWRQAMLLERYSKFQLSFTVYIDRYIFRAFKMMIERLVTWIVWCFICFKCYRKTSVCSTSFHTSYFQVWTRRHIWYTLRSMQTSFHVIVILLS